MTTPQTPQWNGDEYTAYEPYPQQYPNPSPHPHSNPQPHPHSHTSPPQPAYYDYGAPAYAPQPLPEPAPEPAPRAAPAAAPVRTGSPIIAPGMQPALLTAALGVLTAGAAELGRPALAVAAVLLQAVTAAGWFRLNGMWPARQGIALAFLAGATADAALLAASAEHTPTVAVGTLGVWILLILVQQMRHRGSADERLASLTATAAATVLAVLAAGFLAAAGTSAGYRPVVVAAVAVAVATLARALPLPSAVSVVIALLAAAGSGLATAHLTGLGTPAVLLALASGVCALIGLRVASYDFPSRFVHFTAGVSLPLTAAAPVVYLLGHFVAAG